jgi:hypothetical protein
VAFLAIEIVYPRFIETDEIEFKSAGLSLSKGGAFASPELENFLHADPPLEQVFAIYPPLYPWLFGQWTRLTGFGRGAWVGYDALISAGLAILIYALTDAVAGALLGPLSVQRRTVLAFLAALLTLLFRYPGRPDELGMLLGFANVWWLFLSRTFAQHYRVSFVSGVIAGLMLCTSPGVFLAFMPFLVALWLWRISNLREVAPLLTVAVLGVGLAAAICLTPLFIVNPRFYLQYFQHVESLDLLSNVVLDRLAAVSAAWQIFPQRLLIFFATVPILCLAILKLWRADRIWEALVLFLAPLVGFGLVFLLYGSYFYWWFLQPWFLLVTMVVAADFWWSRRSSLAVGWLAIWLAVATVWPAKNYLVRVTLAPDQSLTLNARRLRELIPTGAQVLTLGGWWALGNDRSVYDPTMSDIHDLDRIEYFVTDSNGTGQPGVWSPPLNPRYEAMVRERFDVISDTLPMKSLTVFGIRITNSAYGFGTVVMRRVPTKAR